MSLTEKFGSHLSPLFPLHHKKSRDRSSPSRFFDDLLLARLRSLLPAPDSGAEPIPLSWISSAVDVLSLTIADAGALISDPSLAGSDNAALADHLDVSLSFLDACNAVSAEIDRLLRSRLHVSFAIHLVAPEIRGPLASESARKARESISEWELQPRRVFPSLDLKSVPPRGKISAVRRAIFAVEAISSIVAITVMAALGVAEASVAPRIGIVGDFVWSDVFNEIVKAVAGRVPVGLAAEISAMEGKLRGLLEAIDRTEGEMSNETAQRLRGAAREAETATREMTAALERLSGAVNGAFRATLATRNAALMNLRVCTLNKCK